MVNITKTALQGFVSTLIAVIISFLLLGFVDNYPIIYWCLQIILIVIIAAILSFYLKSNLECLLYSAFFSISTFLLFFILLLLFSSFSELLLNLMNFGITKISSWNNIFRSLLGGLLIGLIVFGLSISVTLATFNIALHISKSSSLTTTGIEEKFYSNYETSKQSGRYYRLDEKEDYE